MNNGARQLQGRCALVTGSTAGIGLATAHALAAQGADIVLNGFGDTAADLCGEIAQQHAVRAIHHPADVSRPEQVAALVAAARAHGRDRLDILVDNADP